jgi:very-short-patch-repair endonuclease
LEDWKLNDPGSFAAGKRMGLVKKKNLLITDSLKALNPELIVELHPTRNHDFDPAAVLPGSHKSIWWLCLKGHEWLARISHRTNSKSGCPYCSGRLVTNETSLRTTNPEILELWSYEKNLPLTPDSVKAGTNKKVWWKCFRGHEWRTSIPHVTSGTRCPYCLNMAIDAANCLAATHPEIANEWNVERNKSLSPRSIVAGSPKKVWWKCSKAHEWQTSPNHRTRGNTNCPYCSNQKVGGDNNLEYLFPDLCKQWDYEKNNPLIPSQLVPGSNKGVWWLCTRGHSWKTSPQNRAIQNTECPFCRPNVSRLELRIYTELSTIFNDAKRTAKLWGKEFDILIPSIKVCIEVDGYPWHLNKEEKDFIKNELCANHDYTLIRVRDQRLPPLGDLCIFYLEKRRDEQIGVLNELATLILRSPLLLPIQRNSLEKLSTAREFSDQAGFLSLLAQLPGPGFDRSIAGTHPNIAAEWHPTKNGTLQPDMISIGSGYRAHWICEKGHDWDAAVYSRPSSGCPVCSNKKVTLENSLLTKFPDLAKEWHPSKNGDLSPESVVPGSGKKVWWKCSKGHEWMRQVEKRANSGRGCPYCANRKLPDISKYPI